MTEKPFIKTGVIGHPIAHSKSPLIHNHWIEAYGLRGRYDAIDLPCENLAAGIEDLVAQGYSGFNLTVPHKVAVMELCQTLDPLARIVGAVNTVIVRDDVLHGTNTDVFGFVQNIKQHQTAFDFTAGKVLVLGAGGAARAIVQGLLAEGVPEILLVNRTLKNAQTLLQTASAPEKIKTIAWEERDHAKTLADVHLVVNTTTLGMSGKEPLSFALDHLSPHALVNDIVYAPLMTPLLQDAARRGHPYVTGIGMLLHQARPAFSAWYGLMPEIDPVLEKKVLA